MRDKRRLFLPIKFIMAYLFFTVILYAVCPWDFKTKNPFITYLLLVLYMLAFYLGYKYAIKTSPLKKPKMFISETFIKKSMYIILLVNIFMLFIQFLRENYLSSIDFGDILQKIIVGINNPSQNYYEKLKLFGDSTVPVFLGSAGTLLLLLWSPISYAVLPLGALNFKKLSGYGKALVILNFILYGMNYFIMGTNKGIFDIVLIIAGCFVLKIITNYEIKFNYKKIMLSIACIILPAILFFNFSMGDRYFGKTWKNNYMISGSIAINYDSLLLQYAPEKIQTLIVTLSSYLCQGYYGFSLTTDVEWTPMFGVGNSTTLVTSLGDKVKQRTLQQKIDDKFGWRYGSQWSTFYSWMANDFSHAGVILVMLCFGYLFGAVVKDYFYTRNIFAAVLFLFCLIELFFVPANNQLSQTFASYCTSIFIFIMWMLSRNVKIAR